jgi:hypothetical protein
MGRISLSFPRKCRELSLTFNLILGYTICNITISREKPPKVLKLAGTMCIINVWGSDNRRLTVPQNSRGGLVLGEDGPSQRTVSALALSQKTAVSKSPI